MSRLARHIEFPFDVDDYKVSAIFVDGVAEEIAEVSVRDGETWKVVVNPSSELFVAIGEALKEYAKLEAAR